MSQKYYETKEFKTLQKEWYGKLKEEGFEDLEQGFEDTPFLAGQLRASSGTLEAAKAGYVGAQVQMDRGLSTLDGLQGRQRTRELIIYRTIGRTRTEDWVAMMLTSQGIGEREAADILDRSRGWLRRRVLPFRAAVAHLSGGGMWEAVESMLNLAPELTCNPNQQ